MKLMKDSCFSDNENGDIGGQLDDTILKKKIPR